MSWLSSAVNHVPREVEHVGDEIAGDTKAATKAAERLGKRLVIGWRDIVTVAEQIFDELTIGIRGLRGKERDLLRGVYGDSLPSFKMLILSLIGVQGRPFTIPASFISTVAAELVAPTEVPLLAVLGLLIPKRVDLYVTFMGRRGFNDAFSFDGYPRVPGQTLVHEACHAWQGYHEAFTWGYIINSVYHQAHEGQHAYDYQPGAQWDQYWAEPQAVIVEDWFHAGQGTDHPEPVAADWARRPERRSSTWPSRVSTPARHPARHSATTMRRTGCPKPLDTPATAQPGPPAAARPPSCCAGG